VAVVQALAQLEARSPVSPGGAAAAPSSPAADQPAALEAAAFSAAPYAAAAMPREAAARPVNGTPAVSAALSRPTAASAAKQRGAPGARSSVRGFGSWGPAPVPPSPTRRPNAPSVEVRALPQSSGLGQGPGLAVCSAPRLLSTPVAAVSPVATGASSRLSPVQQQAAAPAAEADSSAWTP
jgi:hypothetical protein